MKHTHVEFIYYKESGKYYSSGEHLIEYEDGKPVEFYEILHRIGLALAAGVRPGLIDGSNFDTLVTVYTEFGPLSHLFARPR